ncbi:hypothetical protein C8F01DRAFT_1075710 [Mycena amicta]|nr:hypothetical protein C8F01DRAFT_1075710 [Mycena amicta]
MTAPIGLMVFFREPRRFYTRANAQTIFPPSALLDEVLPSTVKLRRQDYLRCIPDVRLEDVKEDDIPQWKQWTRAIPASISAIFLRQEGVLTLKHVFKENMWLCGGSARVPAGPSKISRQTRTRTDPYPGPPRVAQPVANTSRRSLGGELIQHEHDRYQIELLFQRWEWCQLPTGKRKDEDEDQEDDQKVLKKPRSD